MRIFHLSLICTLAALLLSPAFARPPPAPISVQHLAFNNDSSQILYISNNTRKSASIVNFADARTGKLVAGTQLAVKRRILGFTPDGFKTALLEQKKGLSILHNATGKVLRTLKIPSLPWPSQYDVDAAITNKSGTSQLFHSANKRELNVIHTGNGKVLAQIKLPQGGLRGMGMSQDGRIVAYTLTSPTKKIQLYLYDIYQKKITKSLDLPTLGSSFLETLYFSPTGNYLLAGNSLVSLADETIRNVPDTGYVTPVFTPNGRFLLLSSQDGRQVVRYDLASMQKMAISLGLPERCWAGKAVDISPDERFIAYGSDCPRTEEGGMFVSILNAANGAFIRRLTLVP